MIRNIGDMLIPYDVEKLAEIGRTDIDTAAVALKLFEQVGLIEIWKQGIILNGGKGHGWF